METPKPMAGTWTLTAPDGRTWQADSPLRVVALEQRERVPADVAVARIFDAIELELNDIDGVPANSEACSKAEPKE